MVPRSLVCCKLPSFGGCVEPSTCVMVGVADIILLGSHGLQSNGRWRRYSGVVRSRMRQHRSNFEVKYGIITIEALPSLRLRCTWQRPAKPETEREQ